jgi:hypothetical protein
VVAPVEMTLGSVDGLPIVLVMPASPVDTVTVIPARTAWSLKSSMVFLALESGKTFAPNDSLRTSTCWTRTA